MGIFNRNIAIVLFAIFLSACGGDGGSNSNFVDVEGKWTGNVQFNSSGCSPLELSPVNLSGENFTFDVATTKTTDGTYVSIVDQDSTQYSQNFPYGIANGEFNALSDGDFSVAIPTGPTAIIFNPNDGSEAEVDVYVTVDRFCTFIFSGHFNKNVN